MVLLLQVIYLSHRASTVSQYETAWKAFIAFVKIKQPPSVPVKFLLDFFVWL